MQSTISGKEDVINKIKEISDDNRSSETLYPSVGAVVQYTNSKINELSDTGLPVNPENLADGSIEERHLAQSAVTSGKIADKAVTEAKLDDNLQNKISKMESTDNKINEITETNKTSIDAYPSAKAVVTYALPQPTEACQAASGMCVLSVNRDTGAIEWVSVSSPANEN